jgi:hypothetical protein
MDFGNFLGDLIDVEGILAAACREGKDQLLMKFLC